MEISGLLAALGVGLVVGALGRLVVPGRQKIGCLLTVVVGILAALLGTALAAAVGIGEEPGFSWGVLGVQVLVAAVGVALVAGIAGRR